MLAVAAAWAAAEASLFFIVPDVWVGLVALHAPRRAPATLAAVVAGAAVGAALLWFAVGAGLDPGSVISALPGISTRDVLQARAELQAQGAVAFLNGPFQGLPVKLYIHEASGMGISLPELVLFVALNRIERIGPFAFVLAIGGSVFAAFIARSRLLITAGYLLAWTAFYAWYFASRGG